LSFAAAPEALGVKPRFTFSQMHFDAEECSEPRPKRRILVKLQQHGGKVDTP
jgi:hypothetical protein